MPLAAEGSPVLHWRQGLDGTCTAHFAKSVECRTFNMSVAPRTLASPSLLESAILGPCCSQPRTSGLAC